MKNLLLLFILQWNINLYAQQHLVKVVAKSCTQQAYIPLMEPATFYEYKDEALIEEINRKIWLHYNYPYYSNICFDELTQLQKFIVSISDFNYCIYEYGVIQYISDTSKLHILLIDALKQSALYFDDCDLYNLLLQIEDLQRKKAFSEDDDFEPLLHNSREQFIQFKENILFVLAATYQKIDRLVRTQITEIAKDRFGNNINLQFTGKVKTFYYDTEKIYDVKNGQIHGNYTQIESNGITTRCTYSNGKSNNDCITYYKNNNIKTVNKTFGNISVLKTYYPNSNIESIIYSNNTKGCDSAFYYNQNGQLDRKLINLTTNNNVTNKQFNYKNNKLKSEEGRVGNSFVYEFFNYFNNNGFQTLVNGNGYVNDTITTGENSLKYVTIINWKYNKYKKIGSKTLYSNNNKKVNEELVDALGNVKYSEFDTDGTLIHFEVNNEVLLDNKLIVEQNKMLGLQKTNLSINSTHQLLYDNEFYPVNDLAECLNSKEIETKMPFPKALVNKTVGRYLHYKLFIDEHGVVTDANTLYHDEISINQINEIELLLKQLKFKPAQFNGKGISTFAEASIYFSME